MQSVIPDTVVNNALTISPYNAGAFGFLVFVLLVAVVILWRENRRFALEHEARAEVWQKENDQAKKEMYKMLFEVSTDANKVISEFEQTLRAIDSRQTVNTDMLYKRIEETRRDIIERIEKVKPNV